MNLIELVDEKNIGKIFTIEDKCDFEVIKRGEEIILMGRISGDSEWNECAIDSISKSTLSRDYVEKENL